MADDVPSALAVEWQGKKPCELLYEDDYVRAARCTFDKGVTHTCHTHPSYLLFTISGGDGTVQDEKGTRKVEAKAGAFTNIPPVGWHVFANAGEGAISYLVIEKKYQPAPVLDKSACPKD
jgi:quercetin dioxygenase-like cupin family protein